MAKDRDNMLYYHRVIHDADHFKRWVRGNKEITYAQFKEIFPDIVIPVAINLAWYMAPVSCLARAIRVSAWIGFIHALLSEVMEVGLNEAAMSGMPSLWYWLIYRHGGPVPMPHNEITQRTWQSLRAAVDNHPGFGPWLQYRWNDGQDYKGFVFYRGPEDAYWHAFDWADIVFPMPLWMFYVSRAWGATVVAWMAFTYFYARHYAHLPGVPASGIDMGRYSSFTPREFMRVYSGPGIMWHISKALVPRNARTGDRKIWRNELDNTPRSALYHDEAKFGGVWRVRNVPRFRLLVRQYVQYFRFKSGREFVEAVVRDSLFDIHTEKQLQAAWPDDIYRQWLWRERVRRGYMSTRPFIDVRGPKNWLLNREHPAIIEAFKQICPRIYENKVRRKGGMK